MRGKFIVFEGIDASGKGTQSVKLVDYLNSIGVNAIYTHEPTSTNPIGMLIKDWLDKKIEITSMHAIPLLYAADRYEHVENVIKPALERGTWVIADRYFYSTLAYETAILNGGDDIFEWIEMVHKYILRPDYVFYIKISPEESVRRKPKGDRLERIDMQKKFYSEYEKIVKKYSNIIVINGEQDVNTVFNDIKSKMDEILKGRQ